MKKVVSIILAVLMVATLFTGCGKSSVAGKYVVKTVGGKAIEEEFNSMLEEFGEGMTLDDYLKLIGIDSLEEFIVMDLKSDGTVDMAVAGEDPVSGTWKQDGDKITLTVDGETSELTRNGNELEFKMEDQDYVFIKK